MFKKEELDGSLGRDLEHFRPTMQKNLNRHHCKKMRSWKLEIQVGTEEVRM